MAKTLKQKSLQNELKDIKRELRKIRSDKGVERPFYNSDLPPRYKSYLMRANKKGIAFELTIPEFEEMCAADCYYCGDSGYGIDRVNSKLGYTKDNIVPCCSVCNTMKWTLSQNEFFKRCEMIYKFMINK
jgi:hypothetical protein